MMMAKDLKAIIDQFPDNAVVSLGDNWDCNIEGWSYDTEDGEDIFQIVITEECVNFSLKGEIQTLTKRPRKKRK